MRDWPEPDEQAVIKEMLADPDSPHWGTCWKYVESLVRKSAVPPQDREDVVQKVMMAVMKGLPGFTFRGPFTHWLGVVTHNRIMDEYRNTNKLREVPFSDDEDEEGGPLQFPAPLTVSEQVMVLEKLREAITLLEDYAREPKHRKKHTLGIILHGIILGESAEELAHRYKMPVANVRYKLRQIRRYLELFYDDAED